MLLPKRTITKTKYFCQALLRRQFHGQRRNTRIILKGYGFIAKGPGNFEDWMPLYIVGEVAVGGGPVLGAPARTLKTGTNAVDNLIWISQDV